MTAFSNRGASSGRLLNTTTCFAPYGHSPKVCTTSNVRRPITTTSTLA